MARLVAGSTIRVIKPASIYRRIGMAVPGSAVGAPMIGNGAIIRSKFYNHLAAYGSTGDAGDDNSDAIEQFFADVALGMPGHVGLGTHVFTAAIDPIEAGNIRISGDGLGAKLRYGGASTTPGNLFTFGDGTNYYTGFEIEGFAFDSSTELTAGLAMHFMKCSEASLNIKFDPAEAFKFYQALWLQDSSIFDLRRSKILGRNKSIIWSGGVELHCNRAYVKGKLVSGLGTGVSIHIAGGCGGFNSEMLTQLYASVGCLVDTSITGTTNNQLFFDDGSTFDTNSLHGLHLNDAEVGGSKLARLDAWFVSSKDHNVRVQKFTGGTIHSSSGVFANAQNTKSGLYYEEDIYSVFGRGARIENNTAYGIDGSVVANIISGAVPRSNAIGQYGSNIRASNPQRGMVAITQDPLLQWTIDGTANAVTVGNGTFATFPTGSGIIEVTNPANGDVGRYSVGGAAVHFLSSTLGTWVAGAPAGGQCSITYDAGSGGTYRLNNNYGSSQAFPVFSVKLRNSI